MNGLNHAKMKVGRTRACEKYWISHSIMKNKTKSWVNFNSNSKKKRLILEQFRIKAKISPFCFFLSVNISQFRNTMDSGSTLGSLKYRNPFFSRCFEKLQRILGHTINKNSLIFFSLLTVSKKYYRWSTMCFWEAGRGK